MAEIKSMARISNKWAQVTPGRRDQYLEGVQNPRKDWATETVKAAAAYAKGIQAALTAKSFERGVQKTGQAKYIEKTTTKGPDRWAQGVSLSQSDYEAGFAPYREIIARITLPPRGPKGDPANYRRVQVIGEALHAAKVRGV